VSAKGLDFYDRLVDGMLERDIHPLATLFHWDLPQPLQDAGGWVNRRIADWFSDYAVVCVKRLGDRVRHWATINEPNVFAYCGYEGGWHAPGVKDVATARQVFHHEVLAHGRAVRAMRGARKDLQIGVCPNIAMNYPARLDHKGDRLATQAKWERERWYLDPFFLGRYPAGPWREAEKNGTAPLMRNGDLKESSVPVDFVGLNYYFSFFQKRLPSGKDVEVQKVKEKTNLGWPFWPQGLQDALVWFTKTYGRLPIYITENGAAYFGEKPGKDGRVRDVGRTSYLARHIQAVGGAVERGVDLRGYFVWSFMDNFEWSSGYKPRFGLVHVDFATQKRTLKDSGRFYGQVAASNGGCLKN
jgi:beta-glucosidase